MTTERSIRDFWESHPCGDALVQGSQISEETDRFFEAYDRFRYSRERHILRCLDEIDFAGRRVLEIGLGQGADSEQIIRRGAIWSGVDLTRESVERVRRRLVLRGLAFESVEQASALALPARDNSYDIVYSHGVLHHVPEITVAQREIARVLKPGGELVMMVYARRSLNYQLSIRILRRVGLALLYALRWPGRGIFGEHLTNARGRGLPQYLRMENFVHTNTDGPANPYSKVYDLVGVRRDFPDFEIVRAHKEFMHAPPLRMSWLPLSRLFGWHLWVHLRPRKIC